MYYRRLPPGSLPPPDEWPAHHELTPLQQQLQQVEVWLQFAEAMKQGETFDYGRVRHDVIVDASHRGERPYCDGVLQLPYPAVAYHYTHVCDDFEADFCLLAAQLPDLPRSGAVPGEPPTVVTAEFELDPQGTRLYYGLTFNAMPEGGFGGRGIFLDTTDKALEYVNAAAGFVVAFSLLLGVRSTVVTVAEPPKHINAKRARKGKTLLPRITHVDTSHYVVSTSHGGTHASPIPHARRGHLRQLASGKVIPVKHTYVNAPNRAAITSRERYEVQVPAEITNPG